mgnify:CR=1 FL=1
MDIRNLETFIQVAELCNFTKAAEKLGYSQSTVSFQIRQLENELDLRLFERVNHNVSLTAEGREVLSHAYEICRIAGSMRRDAITDETLSGNIRLAMSDSLLIHLLNNRFLEFRNKYPQISLLITSAKTETMFQMINQNEADLVYTLDSHIYHAAYKIVKETKIPLHFAVAKNHPLASKKRITIQDLLNEPFILTEKGMSYRRLLDEKLASMSLEVSPVLETGNTDLICSLVAQNAGITFLPDFAMKSCESSGSLVFLDISDFEIEIWAQVLHHRDKWVSPEMKAVIEHFFDSEF